MIRRWLVVFIKDSMYSMEDRNYDKVKAKRDIQIHQLFTNWFTRLSNRIQSQASSLHLLHRCQHSKLFVCLLLVSTPHNFYWRGGGGIFPGYVLLWQPFWDLLEQIPPALKKVNKIKIVYGKLNVHAALHQNLIDTALLIILSTVLKGIHCFHSLLLYLFFVFSDHLL